MRVCCRYNLIFSNNYRIKSTSFVIRGLSVLQSIGNRSGTMGAHLEIAPSLSWVYGFRGKGPGRPAALSLSVVSAHNAAQPTHSLSGWLLLLRVRRGLFYKVLVLCLLTKFFFNLKLIFCHFVWNWYMWKLSCECTEKSKWIKSTQREKVVPFNSMHILKKDLNQDCHISTAHKHTPKAQTKKMHRQL